MVWFKTPLPGEVETAIKVRFEVAVWCLSTGDSIWGLLSLFDQGQTFLLFLCRKECGAECCRERPPQELEGRGQF